MPLYAKPTKPSAPANLPTVASPLLAVLAMPLKRPSTFLTPPLTFESSSKTSIFTLPSAIYILHPQYAYLLLLGAHRLSYFSNVFIVFHLLHLIFALPFIFAIKLLPSLYIFLS